MVEIAALFAPKSILVISDGSDWTSKFPEREAPYISENICTLWLFK
jgi:hypothetical protein